MSKVTQLHPDLKKIGRLALRHEGEWWNAYYAMPDTMADAIHLGSVKMSAVQQNDAVKQGFMDLMRLLVSDIIQDSTGVRPQWPDGPQTAPESERSGHS